VRLSQQPGMTLSVVSHRVMDYCAWVAVNAAGIAQRLRDKVFWGYAEAQSRFRVNNFTEAGVRL